MSIRFWFALLIVLMIGWGTYAMYGIPFALYLGGDSVKTIGDVGNWGESFEAFNGFISLAGAVFIIRTLILQQQAISEQQKAIAAQAADAHRQRFEATFFELIKLLRELRNELSFKHSRNYIDAATTPARKKSRALQRTGTDALSAFIIEHLFNIRARVADPMSADRKSLAASYDEIMNNETEKTFAPYFRIIYSILKRIRLDGVLTTDEKDSYARLLRSQLTNTELFAIAYNCLSPRAADFEQLLVEGRMFKYMPNTPGRKRLERIIDPLAFQARD